MILEVGTEWLVDAQGCAAGKLASVEAMRAVFERVIGELDLHPIGEPRFHRFPGAGGITGFVMLTESHLAVHTYPEHGTATINLYCCRPRGEWPWPERLAEMLGATRVDVRTVVRTIAAAEAPAWQ